MIHQRHHKPTLLILNICPNPLLKYPYIHLVRYTRQFSYELLILSYKSRLYHILF
nr:MAG TPA: hypothetical protein [Caudoviricetes sp.]